MDIDLSDALRQVEPGATITAVEQLHGGISGTTTRIDFRTSAGQHEIWVAREAASWRDHATIAAEFDLLVAIHEGGLPCPAPRGMASMEGSRPVIFLDYVEGRPELEPSDPIGFVDRFADQLAQIHAFDWTVLKRAPSVFSVPAAWREPDLPQREPEIRSALADWDFTAAANPPVLRHGDFWPGNLIWREGEIAAVIDWEEWAVGEPLLDLAICRLDLWWILGRDAAERFTRRYLDQRPIRTDDLPAHDLCAALRPMNGWEEWASSYPLLGRPDITAESMSVAHLAFVSRALEKMT